MAHPVLKNTSDRATDATFYGKAWQISGNVTSVDVSGGTTGLTTSGGPITTSGVITIAGVLNIANGGTGTSAALTPGSVIFIGPGPAFAQDNANFFWDNTNKYLGIGTSAPTSQLHLYRSIGATGSQEYLSKSQFRLSAIDANQRVVHLFESNAAHTSGTQAVIRNLTVQSLFTGSGGTTTTNTQIYATGVISGGHTVYSRYGINIGDIANSGTLTYNYGIVIESLTAGANNYAVYTNGTTPSYFGGTVLVNESLNATVNVKAGQQVIAGTASASTSQIYANVAAGPSFIESSSGAAASAAIFLGKNNQSDEMQLGMTGSSYTGYSVGSGCPAARSAYLLSSDTASGGVFIMSTHATAPIRIFAGGPLSANEMMRLDPKVNGTAYRTVMIGTTSWSGSVGENPPKLFVNGQIEIANGSGGGLKFQDGTVQYTAVGGSGIVPSTRLINTTLPLSGGGDLSADRTLSLAVTPANNGGAVALQAVTPGTVQTGHINIQGGTGTLLADNVSTTTQLQLSTSTNSRLSALVYNTDAGVGDASVASAYTVQTSSASAYFELDNYQFAGSGARQANAVVLYGNANVTGGMSIAAQAAAPIRFYTGGITSSELRASFGSAGHFIVNTGNQIRTPDGTAAAPSYSFTSDTQSGLMGGASFTALCAGGAQRFIVNASNNCYLGSATGNFGINADTWMTRRAAANWQLGLADAAAPVAQQLSIQGARGGVDTNTAAVDFTIQSSLGTGTGAAGKVIIAGGTRVASGSGQHTSAYVAEFYDSGTGGTPAPRLKLSAENMTAGGTMTSTDLAIVKKVVHRYDWTNAMIVALGAVTASSFIACTLPAKTVVTNAYIVLLTPDSSANALTVALGRTGATYVDYIVASDAKAAANTVYGNDTAERGTNLTGYDLPNYTATTDVRLRFVKTTTNLNTVTGCTGCVILETMIIP